MPQLAGSFYKRHAVTPSKDAPTACGRTVSGAVSLPSRGAFHLSLTVLVRYRSQESAQPWRVVPPASDRVSRARPYSGTGTARAARDSRTGLSPCSGRPFHAVPLPARLCDRASRRAGPGVRRSHNPAGGNALHAYTRAGFGLGPLSLAATRGVSVDFPSSGYLDVSVPRVASSPPYVVRAAGAGHDPAAGFPHSGTSGSKAVCASPEIIAACRALLRLPVPRHPPCALCIFSSQRRPRAGAGRF